MTDNREQQLDQIIADYLQAEESGAAPAADDLIAAHPEFADELREFLDNLGRMDALPNPVAVPGVNSMPVLAKLRYFGDYELLEEIARGGMGVVYKARQTSLNRIVAIKMILAGHLASEEDVKRFRTEAKAAANLKHPDIVPVHEVGVYKGQHYFSMDYIDGRSLAEIVRENPLPGRKAATYARAIAEAVDYAHSQGTLHRDIKPSNVLIDGEDHVHVTDFGLARRVDGEGDLTRTGQNLGTPSYMPPEQAEGKRGLIGPTSDVYSLGATFYSVLTGHPPYQAATAHETIQQVIERDPVSPRVLNPRVPRDLETICLKCLRKEPDRRYSTAREVAEDLTRWLDGKPILARPVSRVKKAWMWSRRRPAIAGMIAAILLACLMTGVTVLQQQRNVRKRVETIVAAIGMTRGNLVPSAIEELDGSASKIVLSELREQYQTADEVQRLSLAYALARFGDVRIEYLVSRIRDTSPEEVDNIVTALSHSRPQAVSALDEAARVADGRQDWQQKARLALVAFRLESPALLRDMCQSRRDPIQRTWFIEECSTWHGDLSALAQSASQVDDAPVRAAVTLAAGSAPAADVTVVDKRVWEAVLSGWHRDDPDTFIHSAAGWTLRKWGLELPQIAVSAQASENRNWYVNSAGMTMLLIPPGSFVRRDDRFKLQESAIDQSVLLTRPFLLADSEVTRRQFQEFIMHGDFSEAEKPQGWVEVDDQYSQSEQYPASVSWYDAVRFCNWLSRNEGLTPCYERTGEREWINGRDFEEWQLNRTADGYRLPTEAEWEYACRAGTETEFCHGDDVLLLDRYANFRAEGTDTSGNRLPNGWGFFDVHGNVQEWCADGLVAFGNETTVVDPMGYFVGKYRAMRGGSFLDRADSVRSGTRSNSHPIGVRGEPGFRVARTLDIDSLGGGDRNRRVAELFAPALDRPAPATLMMLIEQFEEYGVTLRDLVELRADDPVLLAMLAIRQVAEGEMALAADSLVKVSSLLAAQLVDDSEADDRLVTGFSEFLEKHASELDLQILLHMPEFPDVLHTDRFELIVFRQRFGEQADSGDDEQLVGEFLDFAARVNEIDLRSLYESPEFHVVVDQERFERLLERQRAQTSHLVRQMIWSRPAVKQRWYLWFSGQRDHEEKRIPETLAKGFRPAFLTAWTTESSTPRFGTVWTKDERHHRIELALTRQEFEELREELPRDMQLVSLDEYSVAQSVRYSALWVRQETSTPWELCERLSETETAQLAERMTSQGFRASFVNAYDDGTLTTIWVKDHGKRTLLLGLTDTELRRLEAERAHDCLPVCIDSHFNQRRRYCVIIDEAVEGVEWQFVRPDLRQEATFAERRDAGWGPIMVSRSPVHGAPSTD